MCLCPLHARIGMCKQAAVCVCVCAFAYARMCMCACAAHVCARVRVLVYELSFKACSGQGHSLGINTD
jgi:hypothetical protein